MRPLLIASLAAAALAVASSPAAARRLNYADFRVSFSGTETTQVTGSEDCSDMGGGMVPASASETATFKSAKSRVFQFERAGRELNISPATGIGESTMTAKATIDRESQLADTSGYASACGPVPNSSCGQANLRMVLLIQGGLNQISFGVDDFKGFEPGLCRLPLAYGIPTFVEPKDYENHSKIKYSARTGRSLLNPHKHVVIVHGSATATNSGQDFDAHVTSAVSKLQFTMRLVRVPLR